MSIPETPILDRKRARKGYQLNKMSYAFKKPENRQAFLDDPDKFMDQFQLTKEEKQAVKERDWRKLIELGGNMFYFVKISALNPIPMSVIGAQQVDMDHDEFVKTRLRKKDHG